MFGYPNLAPLDFFVRGCYLIETVEECPMLSTKSLNLLADKIAPMVADYIQNDQRFLDVIHETVTDGVADALEETDEEMLFEISMMVFERLALVAN
jgi:hypothetical protein